MSAVELAHAPDAKPFSDLNLSKETLSGLKRGGFEKMTPVQASALPAAIAGRDILGAAKTGSGKTLAFLIPVLERLSKAGWGIDDGLGAAIISPTRELALQIFEVLRVVAAKHRMMVGMVIGGNGGKGLKAEQRRLPRMNVLVCTPGRLLQHLEQTPGFDASAVQLLVLDEADRILDMGFSQQLNHILEYMPRSTREGGERQTLLFSATQTKSVKSLAKLSLHDPLYVAVHETSANATPKNLHQCYAVCELGEKINTLYSFIRSHLKSKTIVFFSSCQQVRYVDAAFRKLRPGVPLLGLHGKVKQHRRVHIYNSFVAKDAAVLFATDIAARGLDFPAVDWVVQCDCPEDADTYIHRVGRTARYTKGGRALLMLMPSEEPAMVASLEAARVPLKRIHLNPSRQQCIKGSLQGLVAEDTEPVDTPARSQRPRANTDGS